MRRALIAKAFGARVFSRPNLTNLNVNKNFTFDQAQCDYILSLDADELVPHETAREIREVIRRERSERDFSCRGAIISWKMAPIGGQYPDWQLRLFRRGQGRFPEKHVHERLQVDGSVGRLLHPLHHHPYESLEECWRKLDFYTSFEAQHLFRAGARPAHSRPGNTFIGSRDSASCGAIF